MVLPSAVSLKESLGRYLPEESYFSSTKNSVKPKAFMPPPDLCLSVFRIDGLTLEEVWEMGEREVINFMAQPKELYGLADIKVSRVKEVNLEVNPNDNPPRHANIIGWPPEKARQKLIAIELAARAKLVLRA